MVDLGGLGQLLTGVGTLVVAAAALRTKRAVESVHEVARAIDKAVNTKPPGSQSISEQVSDLASRLPAEDAAAAKVIEHDQ